MKKEILGNASKANLEKAFKCGECLHFKNVVHPTHKDLCCKQGVKTFAIAPQCFTPDVTQIAGNSDQFIQVATLFQSYTAKQQRILLAMLNRKIPKAKLAFGTKVIFHAMGKDYISNYLAGYVMGYTSSGDLIIGGSPDQKSRGKMFFAYMSDTDTLLNPKQWREKKEKLKAAGKIFDPSAVMTKKALVNDEPPTIDSAPKEWKEKKGKKKKSSFMPVDMVFNVGTE